MDTKILDALLQIRNLLTLPKPNIVEACEVVSLAILMTKSEELDELEEIAYGVGLTD